jgi:LmbE family N-acetylglucosaminyl deacetylase
VSGGLQPSQLGTILGVWAHPDDEAYLMAGTALLAAAAGSTVACVTATAGDAGESADEDRWPRARLSTIRRQELAASLAVLGIADHTWLDLPDGGLAEVDRTTGVGLLAAVIERVQPDTVLTFGPDGITGHSDHVAVGDWAAQAAALVRRDRCQVLAATKTPAWLATFADVNEGILAPDPPCTQPEDLALCVQLTEDILDLKVHALRAQPSQTSGLTNTFGEAAYRAWVATEFWAPRGRTRRVDSRG